MDDEVFPIRTKRIVVGDRTVSIRMERYFWDCLNEISEREKLSVPAILESANEKFHDPGISSRTRSYICEYYRHATYAKPRNGGDAEYAPASIPPS